MSFLNRIRDRSAPPSTELSEENINVLSYYARCDPRMVRQWHQEFLKHAPAGKLSKKNFIEIYQQAYPGINIRPLADLVFKFYDEDNSNWISFYEFFLPNVLYTTMDPSLRARCIFRLIDTNNNRSISLKELTVVLKALYELRGIPDSKGPLGSKIKAQHIIQYMDYNQDSVIDETEFVYALTRTPALREIFEFDYRTPSK
ncbi:hypothetical protein GJ496_003122 [Pomphorhynchus laevis]|nr:hypothetical protein GJ496_003122 [Pomphorhynchus laevis]